MMPRIELTTSPYSFRAKFADEVPDSSITSEKLAPLSVSNDKIQSVGWDKVTGFPGADAFLNIKNSPGPVPSSVWHIRGNLKTDLDKNYVGTADSIGLSFKTNNLEAMRILADGKVVIRNELLVEDYITSRKSADEGGFLLADPLHGLKRVGNDDVRLFTTNGNLLLEGGNVGVGITSPSAMLHVNSGTSLQSAFKVDIGGANKVNIDGNGRVIINSNLSGSDNNVASYPLFVDSKDQGIAIRVDGVANSSNNYVYFLDDGGATGRIEGQTAGEYALHPVTIATDIYFVAIGVAEAIAIGASVVEPSGVVSLAAQLVYTGFLEGYNYANAGVTYSSGGADYAEWLLRLDEDEEIEAGDIVGVRSGKITKSTANSQQILAVSSNPIILGNMPHENQEHLHEKVAFMGQVAVKVVGPVKEGDIIIPSGFEDGTGIAVSPELMTADEYSKVVGRAWSASDNEFVKLINVAVGLNPGDIASIIKMQQVELEALKAQLTARDSDVRKMMAEIDEIKTQLNTMSVLGETTLSLRGKLVKSAQVLNSQAIKSGAGDENLRANAGH